MVILTITTLKIFMATINCFWNLWDPESILIDKELTIIKKFVVPINEKDLNFIKMTLGNS